MAPAATLRVVLFPSSWDYSPANATVDMLAALRLVVSHTDVASISWGLGSHYFSPAQVAKMHTILLGAEARYVTVVASSGDYGVYPYSSVGRPVKEVSLPNSDPLVLSVGGTQLSADRKTGAYIGETAWSDSGGGFSHLYVRPAYQDGVRGISKRRGVPDVAADADAPGGLAQVYTSDGKAYLVSESGTSGSTPLWAGIHRGAGRRVRPSRPRLRQPRHLQHRPQLQLRRGLSRHYDRLQRLSGHSRMGPGDGLGIPQRERAHPSAGPLCQWQQDIAGSRGCQAWAGSGHTAGRRRQRHAPAHEERCRRALHE